MIFIRFIACGLLSVAYNICDINHRYLDAILLEVHFYITVGFTDISVDKESSSNAGDPSSIPGSGRSAGEGKGYPLQCFWASLVAQLVKKLSAMPETWVQSLGWEDPLEKGKATHSSILAWRIPWTVYSMGSQGVKHNWVTFTLYITERTLRKILLL